MLHLTVEASLNVAINIPLSNVYHSPPSTRATKFHIHTKQQANYGFV